MGVDFDTQGSYNGEYIGTPVHRLLPDPITVLTSETFSRNQKSRTAYEVFVDDFGQRSAKAQGLNHVITTLRKMMHTDHRLYVMRSERAIQGILKVGRKNLFIRDLVSGKINEIAPLCVLDFYVHESEQRSGCGRRLFDRMLQMEKVEAAQLGYDRPSPKLLAFLRKHFGLSDYDPQPNNFVVFKAYWRAAPSPPNPHSSLSLSARSAQQPLPPSSSSSHARHSEAPWEHVPADNPRHRAPPRRAEESPQLPFFLGGPPPGGSRAGSRRQVRGEDPGSANFLAGSVNHGAAAKDSLEVFMGGGGGGSRQRQASAGRRALSQSNAAGAELGGGGGGGGWGGGSAAAGGQGQACGVGGGEERGSGTAHWQRSGAAYGAGVEKVMRGGGEAEGGLVGAARLDRRVGSRLW